MSALSSFVTSGNEPPSFVDDHVPGDGRISERRISPGNDRSGAVESLVQFIAGHLFRVEKTILLPEILDPKLHG